MVGVPGDSLDESRLEALRRDLGQVDLRPLPWRARPCDPWHVLVAETMLVQTQVARVEETFVAFIERFPTPRALADGGLVAALESWGRLGYYRRAERLWRAAVVIVETWAGACPVGEDALRALPGVGRYVARAVAVQCGGLAALPIDTNARRVLVRALLGAPASDSILEQVGCELVNGCDADRLTQAVFDVGALRCRAAPQCDACELRRSCRTHREGLTDPWVSRHRQGPYVGSLREARARVLRALLAGPQSLRDLERHSGVDDHRLEAALRGLRADGLVETDGQERWWVPERPR
ncbi:HhH-GPD family protein [Acidimicrobium ferrooxidans DSM 10331]|uniref:HhH-GPD family protein n=1 Tax=Acidimicrobium ferrooxidans (strain DSM 10331 / JCM 15462 / NBRC 103882 / ICP) TaxID=525909 RepID=C7LZV5_ACIFD|nr:HhH-GPD family protein [Acidimicrobium ferrooxidans DSM 10331]